MKKTVTKSTNWLTAEFTKEELLAKKAMATIAAEIQLKRIEMGLDQKQFAHLLGVSQGMISRWESGTYNFTITTLVNICEKLGLSFDPQISPKEVEEASAQKVIFTIFNFANTNYRAEKYSEWEPAWDPRCNNEINKVGVVA